jgi:ParB-like chromosome segregation protein Spo0J
VSAADLPLDVSRFLQSLPEDTVPISRIRPNEGPGSPRSNGENPSHVLSLAETQASLDPIVVHRPTMRVIDGMHRLRAAMLAGRTDVTVRLFDGSAKDAFVLSVQLNVRHGLPLTLAERKESAARIVRSHPQWSDRAIAERTGLSPKTVGRLRGLESEEIPQLECRVGRDGRVRSLNGARARRRAESEESAESGTGPILAKLLRDPSLRASEPGRILLRMLVSTEVDAEQWQQIVRSLPAHCDSLVRSIAAKRVEEWSMLAESL